MVRNNSTKINIPKKYGRLYKEIIDIIPIISIILIPIISITVESNQSYKQNYPQKNSFIVNPLEQTTEK